MLFRRVEIGGRRRARGDELGVVVERETFEHRILVPPGTQGTIANLREGEVSALAPIGALADGTSLSLIQRWPVRVPVPPRAASHVTRPLLTGQRVFDLLFPVAEGGTALCRAVSGPARPSIEQSLAKFAEADVVVYVGCGERGNEMAEVLHDFAESPRRRAARACSSTAPC